MNKLVSCVVLATVATVIAPRSARAGSIDYLTNQSADYIRTMARNAATDAADVVAYNPAGTAFLSEGLYLNLSTQTVFKDYQISYDGKTYKATNPTPILPSFFAVYRKWSFSVFGAFTVPAGGGSLSYDDGVPYLIPLQLLVKGTDGDFIRGQFSGSSMYLAGTVGGAYEFFDMVSVSAAARLVSASKSYQGEATYGATGGDVVATLDTTKKALGVGGIFGVHLRPIKQLDIGLRYETETALELEAETTASDTINLTPGNALESFVNGAKEKKNLPGLLGVGITYHVLPILAVSVAFNYYFIKAADAAADVQGPLGFVKSYDDDHDNGIELAVAAEFEAFKGLLVSAGYNRTIPGANEKTYYDFEYTLAANTVGAGARYTFLDDRLSLTLGLGAVFYEEGQNEQLHTLHPKALQPETFDKFAFVIALGGQYRFF